LGNDIQLKKDRKKKAAAGKTGEWDEQIKVPHCGGFEKTHEEKNA